ncbi:MAG: hypothetical protein ACRD1T_20925, partial [Acidimicrobiia bacterium]
VTLEMERWTDDGVYYIKRAQSEALTLSSPPNLIELHIGKGAPPTDFESANQFSGQLGFVPEDGTIEVTMASEVVSTTGAPATERFSLRPGGRFHLAGVHSFVVASATLRDSSGSILTYTAYPVVFSIPLEERSVAPCEKGAPSAPGVDFQEGPLAEFPDAVSETRGALMQAAHDGDWQALADLIPESGFTFSYGGDTDPIAYWKDLERSGTRVLHILETLMCYSGSEYEGVYLFPDAAEKAPSDWTEGDMAVLREIYSEEELEQLRQQDSYYGWRVGIEPDGTWIFFVAGD